MLFRSYYSNGSTSNLKDRDYVQKVLSTGKPIVADPVMSRVDNKAVIVIAAPIIRNGKVDGVIYVVVPGHTRAIVALRPVEELRRIGANVLGIVANKIPRSRDYYYGGYNYYSPYSNHYTYHSETAAQNLNPEVETEGQEQAPVTLQSVFRKKLRKSS